MANYTNKFEDWYKSLYNKDYDSNKAFTRGEGLSDEDWKIGQNLYSAYQQKNDLLDKYNKTNQSLLQQKSQAQQQASIQLDKLKKYLPTQIKAQGLGGLGVSESTMLQANNNYQNTIGNINSNIGKQQMDLLNNYTTNTNQIDQSAIKQNQNIFDEYEERARQEKEAISTQLGEDLLLRIEDGYGTGWTSIEELENAFNNIKDKLNIDYKTVLETKINDIKNNKEIQDKIAESEKEKELYGVKNSNVRFNNNGGWWIFGSTDFSNHDNFSVIDDSGFKYRIESGGEVTDSNIINKAKDVNNDSVFGYGGNIYMKKAGKIYKIQRRENSYGDHYEKLYNSIYGN